MPAPAKVAQRIATALRRFQPVLSSAKARDINESDTVTIVTDLLSELFGYDKYSEITSEHAIRGTYCDLALKADGALKVLIEVKAAGTDFRDTHIKQAIDYAANQGVDWVVLTNGVRWRIYKVTFAKPIDFTQVAEIDLLDITPRDASAVELLYLLSREGVAKDALDDFMAHNLATSRHLIAALLTDDAVLQCVRRELRRINPDIRVEVEEIRAKLMMEVLKRETVEGEEADAARRTVQKAKSKALRVRRPAGSATEAPSDPTEAPAHLAPVPDSTDDSASLDPHVEDTD